MGLETEPTIKQQSLEFLIGYYTLMLDTLKLSPEWQEAYEQRREQLKEELCEPS